MSSPEAFSRGRFLPLAMKRWTYIGSKHYLQLDQGLDRFFDQLIQLYVRGEITEAGLIELFDIYIILAQTEKGMRKKFMFEGASSLPLVEDLLGGNGGGSGGSDLWGGLTGGGGGLEVGGGSGGGDLLGGLLGGLPLVGGLTGGLLGGAGGVEVTGGSGGGGFSEGVTEAFNYYYPLHKRY